MDASDTTPGEGERSDGRTDEQLDVHIGAQVPQRIDRELRLLADSRSDRGEHLSKSEVIRSALRDYLHRHRDEIAEIDERAKGGDDE